jgi:hypothetical protein
MTLLLFGNIVVGGGTLSYMGWNVEDGRASACIIRDLMYLSSIQISSFHLTGICQMLERHPKTKF